VLLPPPVTLVSPPSTTSFSQLTDSKLGLLATLKQLSDDVQAEFDGCALLHNGDIYY